jgi:2-dehydro-3-deoxyglucarate aldolase
MFEKNAYRGSLKEKLDKNKLTIGSWITLGDTGISEIMAARGFDWLVIDMEHSAITLDKAQELIRVIELCGVVPLVRVAENSAAEIKRVMDAGAYGVVVPMVNTRDDAMRAVGSVKYPPAGKRGVGLTRAQGYGMGFERYKKWVNCNSILIVQVEHIQAIRNLESILGIDGVDASIIGPYDLSASMGHPGEFERKDVKTAIKRYGTVCKKLGKTAGFHVVPADPEMAKQKIKEGFKFIGFSLDTIFLGKKIEEGLRMIKGEKR